MAEKQGNSLKTGWRRGADSNRRIEVLQTSPPDAQPPIIATSGAENPSTSPESVRAAPDPIRRFSIEVVPQRDHGYVARVVGDEGIWDYGETIQEAIGTLIETLASRAGEIWAVQSITRRQWRRPEAPHA